MLPRVREAQAYVNARLRCPAAHGCRSVPRGREIVAFSRFPALSCFPRLPGHEDHSDNLLRVKPESDDDHRLGWNAPVVRAHSSLAFSGDFAQSLPSYSSRAAARTLTAVRGRCVSKAVPKRQHGVRVAAVLATARRER